LKISYSKKGKILLINDPFSPSVWFSAVQGQTSLGTVTAHCEMRRKRCQEHVCVCTRIWAPFPFLYLSAVGCPQPLPTPTKPFEPPCTHYPLHLCGNCLPCALWALFIST